MFALTTILWQLGLKFCRFLKQSEETDRDEDILIIKIQKLHDAVAKGDIKKSKEINNWFHQNLERNKQILTDLFTNEVEFTTQTDLILAACQNKNADMLDFILNKTDILLYLTEYGFDDTEGNKKRTEAFRHALRLDSFDMVVMLYNFWCAKWKWKEHGMRNLEMVGRVLQDAHNVLGPDTDLQLIKNFQSIITLNAFHLEFCTELAELKPSDTPKERAAMILRLLRIYHRYSHFKWRRDTTKPVTKEILFHKNLVHTMLYECYLCTLDIQISTVILVNLNIIRKYLKKRFNKTEKYFKDNPNLEIFYKRAAESYKEFESETYHFLYSSFDEWRLYSPGKMKVTEKRETIKLTLDINKLKSAPVRYLERKSFKRNLKKLAKILKIHIIRRDPAEIGFGTQSQSKDTDKTKVVPLLDENYLQTIKYMRDHYSLKKIVNYIKAIENTNDVNVLMIERVLHVIGEMLKSTDDSYHLSRSTLALLQIAISVETVRHLNNIRDFLSKANKGQLSTRIDMANTQTQTLFDKIKEELIIIKQIIDNVLDIHTFILDKSLLEKGYRLLEQQIKDLPEEAQRHINELCRLKIHINLLGSDESLQFYQEVWKPTGLSDELLEEICWIEKNKDDILSNVELTKKQLNDHVVIILPSFIQNVRRILKLIIENNNNVNTINQQLSNYDKSAKMRDCPDAEEINRIQNKAARLMKRNKKVQIDLELLNEIKNYKHDWDSIKGMIHFCLTECDLFIPISHFNLNEESLPDTPTVGKVNNILENIEAICVTRRSTLNWWQRINRLFKNWKNWKGLRSTHFDGIQKLIGDFAAKEIKQNDPKIAREELIWCLIKRLDLLKQTLLYPQRISLNQHVHRYNHDMKFRIILEMILADIANVLAVCNIRLMKKSSHLLKDIDLGNVLDHGNPILEVIGNSYFFRDDYSDFATELSEKAMMFAEDGESIEALYELFKGNVGYETIKAGDQLKMDDTQQRLYEQFKKSPNWESYMKLICLPIFKPKTGKKI